MSTSSGVVYLTAEGRKELKKELDHLLKVIIPEIAQRIKEAKELGDLSENAEYYSEKEDQGFVAGRILEIQSILANAQIATATKNPILCRLDQLLLLKILPVTAFTNILSSAPQKQTHHWVKFRMNRLLERPSLGAKREMR